MRPAGFNDIYLDNMVTITFLLTLGTRQIKRKQYVTLTSVHQVRHIFSRLKVNYATFRKAIL